MAMKPHLQWEITKICALSLILVMSLASFTTGAIVGGGDDISASIETRRKASGRPIDYSLSKQHVDTAYLLQNAVKVNKNHLRSRILEEEMDEDEGAEEEEQEQDEENNDEDEDNEEEEDNEDEQGNEDDNGEDEDEDEGDEEEAEEQQDDEEENDDEQEDDEEEEDDEQADDQEEAEDEEVDQEEEEEVEEEAEDEEPQINFLKCAAFTVEPNIVDTYEMIQNGEIDEDEAAEIENAYVTEMTSKLNTQESVVFFTFGNGPNDEDQELYMININDWITASYGYDQICHAIDQDDVDYVFSTIPSFSSVKKYSEHTWYAGFNCKADGTGFKTQLFLDNTCNTFSATLNEYYPFKSASNENRANQDYSTQVASDLTKYMVQNVNSVIGNSQYCEESEFCNDVFENSVEVATCGEDGDDQPDRKLVSYQIENDAASSIQDACPSIQTALSINDEYEYSSYELEEMVFLWSNTLDGGQEADRKRGSNYIWLYLAGLLAVGSITAYVILRTKKRTRQKRSGFDSDDSTIEAKKEPLVDKSGLRHSESDIVEDLSAIECTVAEKKSRRKSRNSSRKSRSRSRSRSKSRRMRGLRKKMGFSSYNSDSKELQAEIDGV